ncbi:hypothetical protein PGTUg99_024385 [Puccinia graminis f. sp. tritici]|uniref:Uncharacterized protein n=1 Tax=Puccinia graminis f. sp. tritici TaxID=56615 RepID=A0A5B0N225_PUCGR|nr:hypothetical protein PGTUg99_024385 [Puccinia graminis f. sp. tritici]
MVIWQVVMSRRKKLAAVANLAHQGTDPANSSILAPLHNHGAQLTPLGKEQRKIAVALNPMFTDNEKPSTASRSSGAVTSVMTCVTQKDGPHRPTEAWIGTTQDRRPRLIAPLL